MNPVVKRDGVGDSAGVGEGPPPRRYTPDMSPVIKRDGVGDSACEFRVLTLAVHEVLIPSPPLCSRLGVGEGPPPRRYIPDMNPVVKRDGVGDSAGVGEGPPPRRYTPDMNPVVKRDGVGDSAGEFRVLKLAVHEVLIPSPPLCLRLGVGEGPPPRRYTPDMSPVVKRDGVGDSAGESEVLTLVVHEVLIPLLAVRRGRGPAPT